MKRLELELDGQKTRYRPGETLGGVASWGLDEAPRSVEVRLYWRTEGAGIVDVETVLSVKFEGAGLSDRRPFSIVLPAGPYSLKGTLVSIVWGVEMVVEPKGEAASVEITISPTGEPVRLGAISRA